MKKLIALVLAMACILCLFAGCVDPAGPSTSSTQKQDPSANNPSNPSDPSTPDPSTPAPTEPKVPTLPGAPVGGDKVHIYLPSKNLALGYEASGTKLQAVEGTVTDGVLTAEGAGVFEVIVNADGQYTFLCGGKYLTTGETGNKLSLEYDPSEYSLWTLEPAADGSFYIKSSAVYNGQAQYLEYYSGFTTYKFNESSADIYTFQFFKTDAEQPAFPPKPTMPEFDTELTIEQLMNLPLADGEFTEGRYYVNATVVSVTNSMFGAMTVTDSTGKTISVYNSKNADGSVNYEDMTDKPVKGDSVRLYCTVQIYGGEYEIKEAYIVSFTHNKVDESKYTEMTIEEARNAAVGTLIKVDGVVAQITYASGQVPCGVILVDETGSIYVYGGDLAQNVNVGNTVSIAASKTYWILESEQANASKFGYKGCNQLEDPFILSNDNGNSDFDKSWITDSSVKEIVDTDASIDISTKIFKVTALVHKDNGAYLNYYFYDLDGKTGSYIYTQCNCAEFGWLEQYDGKICTVYLMAFNCKSTAGDCFWRLLPVAVEDNGFDPSSINIPENAIKFYATNFQDKYIGNPDVELVTSAENELLNYSGVVLSYASSNESIVSIVTENGKTYMKCLGYGTATITITAEYNGETATKEVTVTVEEAPDIEYVNVAGAITTKPGTDTDPVYVTVKGIVGPSLVNQVGFYLIDGSGVIAIKCDSSVIATLEVGNEVIITGKRYVQTNGNTNHFGQTCIIDAKVEVNFFGNHKYSSDSFITGKTVADLYNLDATVDYSTSVFVIEATVNVPSSGNSQPTLVGDDGSALSLYCSGFAQYEWLRQFAGQKVTLEVAACNWNNKTYWRGCVLAVILENGTRVVNTLNFDND